MSINPIESINPNYRLNLDINPETLEEMENIWINENPEETDDPKRYFDFYQDIVDEMSSFLGVSSFEHHEFDSKEPLYYKKWDERIEQYWKGENEDLIIWDFEGNIHKHRYTVTFQPKTMKGMHLLSLYLVYAAQQEWFMDVDNEEHFRETNK